MGKTGITQKKPAKAKDITGTLVIREKNLSLVALRNSDIPVENNYGYGLYYRDCRFLSGYLTRINGLPPTEILSSDEKNYSSTTVLTNPVLYDSNDKLIDNTTISIRKERFIAGELSETIDLENFNQFKVALDFSLGFQADFADIFTVRGATRGIDGKAMPPSYDQGTLTFTYQGKDGRRRETRISFDPAPSYVEGTACHYSITLEPHAYQRIAIIVSTHDLAPDEHIEPELLSMSKRLKGVQASYVETEECCINIWTNNGIFNKAFMKSLADLRMLYMIKKSDVFYSAGVPWFDALFGRDSLISSMQVLPYNPTISKSTLQLLATYQGTKTDDWRDEQPGKILHELRVGEKANLNDIPQSPYYGSVDATPLFLIVLAEHIDWTGDMGLFRQLQKNVEAALAWIDTASDKNGFLTYTRRSSRGLDNQGWKDSFDSISHSDGTLAKPPIALPEVQGYVYMAKKRMATLYDRLGNHDLAKRLRKDAANLFWNFNEKFWMEDQQFFAEALDARGQCDVISSNPGQALWGEIVEWRKAESVVKRLFEGDMYSGWGIHTLSTTEKRYNPLGYHNGTVWPHDNSFIAMGMKKYGYKDELTRLFTGMYDAAGYYMSYRLPELFGGYHRQRYSFPIKYPVACSPQAWASGTIPYMLTASLGMVPDALEEKLTLNQPQLPPWLETLKINSLHVGRGRVQLEFRRIGDSTLVNVVEKRGNLQVEVLY
jgi:glycogen debranching enzyme